MEILLTAEQEALLEQAAARTSRPTQDLIREAIQAYLDHDRWFCQAVEQGREAARNDELLDHKDVVQRLEERFGD